MSRDSTENNAVGTDQKPPVELDARGLYCPEPVMMLHTGVRGLAAGALLRLVATDPSTARDVPKFCLYLGHELVEEGRDGDLYVYLIRKKAD